VVKVRGDVTNSTIALDAPAAAGTFALRSFTAGGDVSGSRVTAAGALGTIRARSLTGSEVYSGVAGNAARLPAAADLAGAGAVGNVTVKTFANAVVAADTLGVLKLGTVSRATAAARSASART
jgi:hypothetical protein